MVIIYYVSYIIDQGHYEYQNYLTKYWYSLLHLSLGDEEKKVRMDLYFDPDLHPGDTHKSFVDFVKRFELRYGASYPDPPKHHWMQR